MKIYQCKSCKKNIVWITTSAGKLMPCDAVPVAYWEKSGASGKVVLTTGQVVSCEFSGPPGTATGYGHISHFSTCPNAEEFRNR